MTARRATLSADLSSSRNAALRRRKLRTTSQRKPHVKQQPNGNWKVWYRTLDGVQKTKTFPDSARWTKAELDRAVDKLLRPINDVRAAALHDDTLYAVWCGWRARRGPHVKPTTLENYQMALRVFKRYGIEGLHVARATKADVHDFLLRAQADGYAPGTVALWRTILSSLFTYAIDAGLRDNPNPASGRFRNVESNRRVRPKRLLEPGKIDALLDALPIRFRTLVAIAAFTGFRRSEIAALRWDDLADDFSTLRVDENKSGHVVTTPKTRSSIRTVKTGSRLAAYLASWHAHQRPTDPRAFMFANRDGGVPTLTNTWANPSVLAACEAAGIERLGWHDLRHAHTTWARNAGVPIEALRDRLGHSSVTVLLDVYSDRKEETLDVDSIVAYGTGAAQVAQGV